MTRQAGVSALTEEQRHLAVSALRHYRTACSQSGTAFADNIDSTIAALLATAPPEQTKCPHGHPEKGLTCGPECEPPKAVSAGALDAVALHDESFQLVDKWFVSKCDKAEIPTILLNWKQTMDSLRPLVAAALAAHDQKVRTEALEEAVQLVENAFENSWVVQDTIDAIRALKGQS